MLFASCNERVLHPVVSFSSIVLSLLLLFVVSVAILHHLRKWRYVLRLELLKYCVFDYDLCGVACWAAARSTVIN